MPGPFLDEQITRWAAIAPAAPAVGTPSGWITYGELAALVHGLTADLQQHGVGPGEFVLNLLPNGVMSVAAGLAVFRAGACLVEINRDWGRETIARIVGSTHARYAFMQARDLSLLEGHGTCWTTLWVTGRRAAVERPSVHAAVVITIDRLPTPTMAHRCVEPVRRSGEDLAVLLFTSASTGAARGVMLSHRNIAANTASIVDYLHLTAADRVMSILPLSYSYGRSLLQTHLWTGGSIFFDHRFMYPRVVLEAIGAQGCTGFAGVPLTFELLRRNCNPRTVSMPALRYVTQAGGPMTVDVRRWVRDSFSPAEFYVMYGQTEATARLSYLPPGRFVDKPATIGIPIPGVELRVVDDAGRVLADGMVGNLIARGDNITSGYFGAPEDTADILKDGWLWTGDLATRDSEGFFSVVGRTKTMLKVSGHRFSPREVEERLVQHPAVVEACVVGTPDPVTGEAAQAFVVLETAVDPEVLRRFCAETMPSYKVPKTVVSLDQLPHSSAGKVLRADLEQLARQSIIRSNDGENMGCR